MAAQETHYLVENLFRREYGKITAVLTRLFGLANLGVAEDIAQETFIAAMRSWSFGVVPDNPSAWLMQTAKNKALNELKRRQRSGQRMVYAEHEGIDPDSVAVEQVFMEHEIRDSRLRMLFACCHPELSLKAQIILMLKVCGGFSVKEIAFNLMSSEDAVAKSLVRTRKELRKANVSLDVPFLRQSHKRLDAVLTAIYLIFNEGYKASSAGSVIKAELCYEAIRLATLLTEYPLPNLHETEALLALMYFHTARFGSRLGSEGEPILLEEQDRSQWDARLIHQGTIFLERSRRGDTLTRYHIEAGIAALHCHARSFKETDWHSIVEYYDLLLQYIPTPVLYINRAIALGWLHGPEAGLGALAQVKDKTHRPSDIEDSYLYHAGSGHFFYLLRRYKQSKECYTKALCIATTPGDILYLQQRVHACTEALAAEAVLSLPA